jgi:hypothetical protein
MNSCSSDAAEDSSLAKTQATVKFEYSELAADNDGGIGLTALESDYVSVKSEEHEVYDY